MVCRFPFKYRQGRHYSQQFRMGCKLHFSVVWVKNVPKSLVQYVYTLYITHAHLYMSNIQLMHNLYMSNIQSYITHVDPCTHSKNQRLSQYPLKLKTTLQLWSLKFSTTNLNLLCLIASHHRLTIFIKEKKMRNSRRQTTQIPC